MNHDYIDTHIFDGTNGRFSAPKKTFSLMSRHGSRSTVYNSTFSGISQVTTEYSQSEYTNTIGHRLSTIRLEHRHTPSHCK